MSVQTLGRSRRYKKVLSYGNVVDKGDESDKRGNNEQFRDQQDGLVVERLPKGVGGVVLLRVLWEGRRNIRGGGTRVMWDVSRKVF